MADFWQRWRGAILGGLAVWLMSLPLLTSHPTSAANSTTRPLAATASAVAKETSDRVLLQELARERQIAVGASTAVTVAASQPAAVTVAVPAATVRPALPVPPRPAAPAAPAVHANNIVIPRLGLNQPVGWYSDCLGRAAVPRWGTVRWSCAGANNVYIMAHNPGVFTPILNLHAGDIIEYGDPSGRVHTYRVSYTTIVSNTQLWPLSGTAASSITLQTCWTWDGSRDFIVRGVEF
jgi:hypothetical protein